MNILKSLHIVLSHPLNRKRIITTLKKVLFWKINQLWYKHPMLIPFGANSKLICYPSSAYASMIYYMDMPDYLEMTLLQKILRKDSVFIDIGAGLGEYSILASEYIQKGSIFAFEPIDAIREQFIENIRLNNRSTTIELHSEVLSNTDAPVWFNEEAITEVSHISLSKKGKKHTAITLDSFIHKHRIKHIDLMKIDVEGAEMLVLKGAQECIKKGTAAVIILELNTNNTTFKSSHKDIISHLQKNNYLVLPIENHKLVKLSKVSQLKTQNVLCVHRNSLKKFAALIKSLV